MDTPSTFIDYDGGLPVAARDALEADRPRREREESAYRTANTTPLPGPLLAAFTRQPIPAPGLPGRTLRPIVVSDIVTFQKLGSPLVKLQEVIAAHPGLEDAKLNAIIDDQVKFSEDQIAEAAWVLLNTRSTIAQAMTGLRDTITHQARIEVLDRIAPADLQSLLVAVFSVWAAGFSTRVGFEPKPLRAPGDDLGGDSGFLMPPPKPMMMVSDGGSTCLAR